MADPSATERAYRRLKSDILNGVLPTGPIDIRILGDRLRMSVTPVREALARLSAERLVKLAPHHGYAVAAISMRRLENLYELSAALVDLALSRSAPAQRNHLPVPDPARDVRTYEAGMMSLVREIATAQANLELAEHLVALGERLAPARRCEFVVIPRCQSEMERLFALWDKRQTSALRVRVSSHFSLRVTRVDAIARQLAAADEV